MYLDNINIPAWLCGLLQSPADYSNLKVTRKHRIQAGDLVQGMSYFSGRLYTLEWREEAGSYRYRLAVYNVTDQDTITLLNTLDLMGVIPIRQLCVDRQNGRVCIPCYTAGVCVVRYTSCRLVPITTLRCVRKACSLGVVSPDTLYVCDRDSKTSVWWISARTGSQPDCSDRGR